MTCPNYSKQGEEILCRIHGVIIYSVEKERECLGVFELCLQESRKFEAEKRERRESPQIPISHNFSTERSQEFSHPRLRDF